MDETFIAKKREKLRQAQEIAKCSDDDLEEFITFLFSGRSYNQSKEILNSVMDEIGRSSVMRSLPEIYDHDKRIMEERSIKKVELFPDTYDRTQRA